MKGPFCMPRLRATTCPRKTNRLTPVSLLDRLREAAFRLIMFSALSKAAPGTTQESSRSYANTHRSYYPNNAHHSEAVADCIEFIKKSATAKDNNRDSVSSTCSIESAAVYPLS